MLSPAESGNGVSHVPESTPESAADAVGAGFDFGAIVKGSSTQPDSGKNPLAVTVPNDGIQRDGLMPADPSACCPGVSQCTFFVSSTQCGAQ